MHMAWKLLHEQVKLDWTDRLTTLMGIFSVAHDGR